MPNVPDSDQFNKLYKQVQNIQSNVRPYVKEAVDQLQALIDRKLASIENRINCVRANINDVDTKLMNHFESHADEEIVRALDGACEQTDAQKQEAAAAQQQAALKAQNYAYRPWIVNIRGYRSGHTWTPEEEAWLEREYSSRIAARIRDDVDQGAKDIKGVINEVLTELACENGRTHHALECRLEQLGYDLDWI